MRKNIIQYENRPFAYIAEMDQKLLSRWNSIVKKDDEVYVMGDFGAKGIEECILNQLDDTQ